MSKTINEESGNGRASSAHSLSRPRAQSAAWDDNGVLVYTTLNHIKYCLPNGDNGIIRTLDVPVYITRVIGNIVYALDREGKNRQIQVRRVCQNHLDRGHANNVCEREGKNCQIQVGGDRHWARGRNSAQAGAQDGPRLMQNRSLNMTGSQRWYGSAILY